MFNGIFGYITGGAVIGMLARFIKPGADPMGWILTIVLGIVGAFIGSWVATQFGVQSRVLIWVLAIIAAIVVLSAFELVRARDGMRRR
ncbi:MAG: GlsB/YeaQ/YmgE family stress response membrane protein [Lysobacter sp.]